MHEHNHANTHEHNHDHGHSHDYKGVALQRLGLSLGITVVVMFVEVAGGWYSGSIALISDAGHMLTHAFAIAVSIFGILMARQPVCHHRTFGMLRAEVLAAFINGIFLLGVSAWIIIESIERFMNPQSLLTMQMLMVALLGLAVNIFSIFLLQGSRHNDLNIRSVFMHMIGDAASSVAIVIAAVVIRYTSWNWLDPAVSLLIALWIAVWALGLLKESARILLEMAPRGQFVHDISDAMRERFPAILETSHEHVWTITESVIVFSAHLLVDGDRLQRQGCNDWLETVEQWLAHEYKVTESTLQVRFK
jgi:cobalt-zinc-cadmium efflux system protein